MNGDIYLILLMVFGLISIIIFFHKLNSSSNSNFNGNKETGFILEEDLKRQYEEHEYFHGMLERFKKPPKDMYIGQEDVGDNDPRLCFSHNGKIVRKVCFDYIPHKITHGCKLPQGVLKSKSGRDLQDYLDELHQQFPSLYLEEQYPNSKRDEDERAGYFFLKNTRFGMEFCSAYFRRKYDVIEQNLISINIDLCFSSNRVKARYDIDMQLLHFDEEYIYWHKYDLTLGQLKNHINQYIQATNDLYDGIAPRKFANY